MGRDVRWRGMWTLFLRETRRFLKVKTQTILAPVVTGILYVVVFRYAMGERSVPGLGVDYFTFLVPGLVMMSMLQNAFANSSSSMIGAKVMNVHVYLLMAPLSAFEVVSAFLAACIVRAAIVGGLLILILIPFVQYEQIHFWAILFYGLSGCLIMGALGFLGGMWAKKFDDMSLISNFVVMPLTFLSGVFYSIEQLPVFWRQLNALNPFFYIVDGFRYGFLGIGDTDPMQGVFWVGAITMGTCLLAWQAWKHGWQVKE